MVSGGGGGECSSGGVAAGRLFALQWVSHTYVHRCSTKCSVGYKKEKKEEDGDKKKTTVENMEVLGRVGGDLTKSGSA